MKSVFSSYLTKFLPLLLFHKLGSFGCRKRLLFKYLPLLPASEMNTFLQLVKYNSDSEKIGKTGKWYHSDEEVIGEGAPAACFTHQEEVSVQDRDIPPQKQQK